MRLSHEQIDELAEDPTRVGPFSLRQPTIKERRHLVRAENAVFRGYSLDIESRDFLDLVVMLTGRARWFVRLRILIWSALCRRSTAHRVRTRHELRLAQNLWNWRELRLVQRKRGY